MLRELRVLRALLGLQLSAAEHCEDCSKWKGALCAISRSAAASCSTTETMDGYKEARTCGKNRSETVTYVYSITQEEKAEGCTASARGAA